MELLIDDVRDLNIDVIARTSEAGKKLLSKHLWDKLYLDHDLGPGQEDGYWILKWAVENHYLPNHVQLVTSNPVGRENMANLLISQGFVTRDNVNYSRVTTA